MKSAKVIFLRHIVCRFGLWRQYQFIVSDVVAGKIPSEASTEFSATVGKQRVFKQLLRAVSISIKGMNICWGKGEFFPTRKIPQADCEFFRSEQFKIAPSG